MYRNARPLELALWQYYYEKGSREAVISALVYYQNEDGGFGHALEADSWNPNSSPYTTLTAMNILERIGLADNEHPMMRGIYKFLDSGIHRSDNGWYFNIPTNNDYAHAPWWTYNMEANATEGIGLTADIAGHLLKNADKESELYKKALTYTELLINKMQKPGQYGDMGIGGYIKLLGSIEQAGLTERFDCVFLTGRLTELVNSGIVRDNSKWAYYSVRPSDYIVSPESIFYPGNEDIVEEELDYLIETRQKDGVWNITWSWFDNNVKYAKEFAISENWWKASKAIQNLGFLKNFGRIEE
jgi:hypothetical protein